MVYRRNGGNSVNGFVEVILKIYFQVLFACLSLDGYELFRGESYWEILPYDTPLKEDGIQV